MTTVDVENDLFFCSCHNVYYCHPAPLSLSSIENSSVVVFFFCPSLPVLSGCLSSSFLNPWRCLQHSFGSSQTAPHISSCMMPQAELFQPWPCSWWAEWMDCSLSLRADSPVYTSQWHVCFSNSTMTLLTHIHFAIHRSPLGSSIYV